VTHSVSSTDALIFLAGTNLGAAAYEYVLARLTRRLLRRADPSVSAAGAARRFVQRRATIVQPAQTCVLAARLSEDPGCRVLLLEAGPADDAEEISVPAACTGLWKGRFAWDDATTRQPQR
jgi:hypothetical protein